VDSRVAVGERIRGEVVSPVLPVNEVGRTPLKVMELPVNVLRRMGMFRASPFTVMGVDVNVESVKEPKAPELKVTVVLLKDELVDVRSVPVTFNGKLTMEAWFLNVTIPPRGMLTLALPHVGVAGLSIALSRMSSPAMFTAPTQYQLLNVVVTVRVAPTQIPVAPAGTRVPVPGL
jgi:hypothetical protein